MAKQPIKKPLTNETQLQAKFRTPASNPIPDPQQGVPYTNPRVNKPAGTPIQPPGDREYSPLKDYQSAIHASGASKQGGGASLVSPSELNFERFDAAMPGGYNNEDAYGQGQDWLSKMGAGVGKGLVLTGTTFLQSTVGMVNGVAQWIDDGKFSSFYDNEFNRQLDDINKASENLMPNYYTEAEKNAPIYSPSKLFSANFIWDGVIKNMGFAAGAMLSGNTFMGIGRAVGLKALPMAARMTAMGKGGDVLKATQGALGKAGKSGEIFTSLTSMSDDLLRNYNILNKAGRVTVAGLATSGEAGFEAFHNLNDYRDNAIQEYKDLYGAAPTGEDLDEINSIAEDIGNTSFGLNVGVLSVTNYIQFPKIMGSTYKGEKSLINSMKKDIGEIVQDKATKQFSVKAAQGGVMRTLNFLKKGQYIFAPSEAFEEGAQFAISHGTEHYYTLKDKDAQSVLNSAYEGVKHTLTTNEGWENIVIGGLSGAIMIGGGKLLRGEAGQKKKDTNAAVAALNQTSFSDFLKEHSQAVVRGANIQEEREQLLKEGDVFGSKNKEADYLINYLTPRIKYGRMDLVEQDIKDVLALASSKEGFSQLQEQGIALQTDTPAAFINRTSKFKQTANDMHSLYQGINLRYGGMVTDEGKQLYSEDVINKMIYSATKVDDFSKRMEETMDHVVGTEVDMFEMVNEVVKGKDDLFNKAKEEIVADESIPGETKQTALDSLRDVTRMALHKDMHMQEYEEFRTDPLKYAEKPNPLTENLTETPETTVLKKGQVKIVGKTGEQVVDTGEEYYLGRVVDYSDSKNEVYRMPKLVILGENEDGTIRIKDSNGERDVKPEVFEDYKLGKVSALKKNKKANFYYNNWNTIFTYNFGKDKGGKVKGRLTYDPKSERLFFTYRNKKGKVKYREVVNTHFSLELAKKKGFSAPIIESVGTLTAEQQLTLEQYQVIDDARRTKLHEKRLEILGELVTESNTTIAENKAKLEKQQKALEKARKALEKLDAQLKDNIDKRYKKTTYTKIGRDILGKANRLRIEIEKTQSSINELTGEVEEVERTIDFVEDIMDSIEFYPTDTREFVLELKKDLHNLQDLRDTTKKQLSTLEKTKKALMDALETAKKMLADLIKQLGQGYAGIPVDHILDEVEYFADIEDVFDDIESVPLPEETHTKELVDQLTDEEVKPKEAQIKKLIEQIAKAEELLKDVNTDIQARQNILNKFKEVYDQYKNIEKEKEIAQQNKAVADELTNSLDKGQQINHSEEEYEANSKKTAEKVVTSTIAPTGLGGKPVKEYAFRAQRFGNKIHALIEQGKKFKGQILTSKTQEEVIPGLTEALVEGSDANASDVIVMVVTNEEGKPVDENGEVIAPGEDMIDKAIYQVFPSEKLGQYYSDGFGSMFRNGTPKSTVEEYTKRYEEWRKATLASEKAAPLQDFSASFGILDFIEVLDENGNKDEQASNASRSSASSAGLIKNSQTKTHPMIMVATTNESISNGTVTFDTPLGRVFLKVPGGLVKLFTRRNTAKESETIFKVLHQMAKNIQEDGNAAEPRTRQLYSWLRTVVHWGIPKDPDTKKRKDPGVNNIWFESIENEEGEIENRLFFGSKEKSVIFTPTALEQDKENLIAEIMQLYNNVNATSLNQKQFGQKYRQITDIDSDGNPVVITWPNYQSFLLSDKAPDSKGRLTKTRNLEDIPVQTRVRPLKGENDSNRTGVYFTMQGETLLSEMPEKKETPTAEAPAAEAPTPGNASGHVFDGETVNTIDLGVLGKVDFILNMQSLLRVFKKRGSIAFDKGQEEAFEQLTLEVINKGILNLTVPEEIVQQLIAQGIAENASFVKSLVGYKLMEKLAPELVSHTVASVKNDGPVPVVPKKTVPTEGKKETTTPKYNLDGQTQNTLPFGKLGDLNFIADQERINAAIAEDPTVLDDVNLPEFMARMLAEKMLVVIPDKGVHDAIAEKYGDQDMATTLTRLGYVIFDKIQGELQTPEAAEHKPTATTEVIATDPVKPAKVTTRPRRPTSDRFTRDAADEEQYRMTAEDQTEDYKEETWTKVEKWMKKVLPQLPLYRTKRVIQATNGGQAWGMFRSGAIYVYENAEAGTTYHEVFEAIWHMFTPLRERNAIIKEFRDREGYYIDRFTREKVKYSEATDAQLKEELAEEFRDYNLYNTSPKRKAGSLIKRLFNELKQWIESFFTGVDAKNNTERLFKDINRGRFAAPIPQEGKLSLATNGIIDIDEVLPMEGDQYRIKTRIDGISAVVEHHLYQHLTYQTLKFLSKDNEGLFSLTKNVKGSSLYNDLLKSIVGDEATGKPGILAKMMFGYEDLILEDPANEAYYLDKLTELDTIEDAVRDNWGEIVERHKKTLIPYEIIFDENDETLINDENNDGKGDYMDSNKLDSFKKSSTAIKLLFATLPDMHVENGKLVPKRSSIGSVLLEKADKVFITLMNDLHNTTSPEAMLLKIKELSKESGNENYAYLYKRLTGVDTNDNVNFKIEEMTQNNVKLISGLWKTLKKQNPEVLTMFKLSSGETVVGDINLTNAPKAARFEMQSNITAAIRAGSTPYFSYDVTRKVYNPTNALLNTQLKQSELKDYVKFLRQFNIEFSLEDLGKLDQTEINLFREAVDGILASMKKMDNVFILSKKTLNIDKRLLQLGAVQTSIETPEFNSTYYSLKGERNQSFIGVNAPSNLYHTLSQLKNIKELENTQYAFLLTDKFAQGSILLEKMFDEEGNRIPNTEMLLNTVYVEGTNDESNGKKITSPNLTFAQRLEQEINLNLSGVYNNLVPGDAALEWALRMHQSGSPNVTTEDVQYKEHYTIFKDYFLSEIGLSRDGRIVSKGRDNTDLRFFKGILADMDSKKPNALHDEIVAFSKTNSAEETYDKYEAEINKALDRFVKQESKDTETALRHYGLVSTEIEGATEGATEANKMVETSLGFTRNKMTLEDFALEMKALTLNYMVANIEMHKLIYSDPYIYKDELKRIKNFNSPRQAILNNSQMINLALEETYGEGYPEGTSGYTDFSREYFRTISLSDVNSAHDLPGYENPENREDYEETDGGGMVTLQGHRIFKIRAGEWTDANERQFAFDMEYEDRVKAMETLPEAERVEAERRFKEFLRTNPNIKSTYTMSKPIVSGSKSNGRDYNDVVMDKYALIPISFRMFHEMNPESNMLKFYNKMRNEDIDYAVYDSGRKVGVEKSHSLYNQDGSFNEAPFLTPEEAAREDTEVNSRERRGVTNIPFSIISLQTEVPSKDKNGVTQGSQITKLVTLDFLEAGVPIDAFPNLDATTRAVSWLKMSEEAKQKASPLYKKVVHNQRLLEERIQQGFDMMLRKLGLSETATGYQISDRNKLVETLESEIQKQDTNSNILQAFDGFRDGDVIIEATPVYQQIRNILYSVANSNVVRPKINGGMKVQAPSTLFEADNRIVRTEHKGKTFLHSDILDFYEIERKDENGNPVKIRAAEIMVGRWFNTTMSDKELIKYLNETTEGQKLLEGVAFRTPTQKQNSIDAFVIKKLLPKEMGDTVVVPSALVRKAGSDFDIDKLSIYLKNVFYNPRTGRPRLVEFLTSANSTLKERYITWVKERASADAKGYVRYLSKKELNNLRADLKSTKLDISKDYLTNKEEVKSMFKSQFEDAFDEREETKDAFESEQDSEVRALFQLGSVVFNQLSDEARDEFFSLKEELNNKGINGPKEIEGYLALANTLMKREDIDLLDKKHIKNMIAIYEDELIVLGRTSEEVDAINKEIDTIKVNKESALNAIAAITSQNYIDVMEAFEGHQLELEFSWAEEVASISGLPTIDEFSKKDIYQQNTAEAVENEYIDSLRGLILDPLNFDRLIEPNSAEVMQNLAKEVKKKQGQEEVDYGAPEFMLSRVRMSALRRDFVGGKRAIGISAVAQTNHSQNQRENIFVDVQRLSLEELGDDASWLYGLGDRTDENSKLRFRQFNKVKVGDRELPSLSQAKDATGKTYISDIIGMFIDGYVDISKGPWIMEMGATPLVTGTWLFLVKIGVPIKTVTYFMNQPIIKELLVEMERSGTSNVFGRSRIENLLYAYDSEANSKTMATDTKLKSMIGKQREDMRPEELAQQRLILVEFLKASKMAEHLFLVTQGTNTDTANLNDPFLVFKKQEQYKLAEKTVISSAKRLVESSFVGKLNTAIGEIREAFANILISDRNNEVTEATPTPRKVLERVLLPYIRLGDREFIRLSQKAVADFFDWATQNNTRINNQVATILLGDTTQQSAAKQIMRFKYSILGNSKAEIAPDTEHPLYGNMIIENVMMTPGPKEGQADVIVIKGKANKVNDQNQIINSFEEIKDYLASPEGQASPYKNIYGKLVRLAILQSGLTSSPISYSRLLPYEDFKAVYNDTLSDIENLETMENFAELNVFQRNNWNRPEWVPVIRRQGITSFSPTGQQRTWYPAESNVDPIFKEAMKRNKMPKTIFVDVSSFNAKDVITYTWTDKLSGEKLAESMRNGDTSHIHKMLMRKVYDENGPVIQTHISGTGNIYLGYTYVAVNAWGEGVRAQELYDYGTAIQNGVPVKTVPSSVMENGYEKVENTFGTDGGQITKGEVSDQEVVALREEGKKAKESPEDSKAIQEAQEPKPAKVTPSPDGNLRQLKLRDGKFYTFEQINAGLLIKLGYTDSKERGRIIRLTC